MIKRFKHGGLYVLAAGIVCATLNTTQADSITALPNPFALSRLNANSGSLSLADDKGEFVPKDGAPDSTTIEESGEMTSNFVYYSTLQVTDGSLIEGDGFGGGGFVGGGGGGTFGVPIPGVDYFPDEDQNQTNNAPVPAPGAAVLGLIGLGMVRRFKRRFA